MDTSRPPDSSPGLEPALWEVLPVELRNYLLRLHSEYSFTYQEQRIIFEIARDLEMWQTMEDLPARWNRISSSFRPSNHFRREAKKKIFQKLNAEYRQLKTSPKNYPSEGIHPPQRSPLTVITSDREKRIFGSCPVASEKTVCCNLKTIDVVENCAYGCSYCTIQTFYGDQVAFQGDLKRRLAEIKLDPQRRYHIGTGQSSDSLVWGNKNGLLDDLCGFAADNPNILLEFKTKSANASYFLKHEVPRNVVCSWSLNTETIVNNEEHFTAPLSERLHAARKVADAGVGVAFHFHPMVHYQGWEHEYPDVAQQVLDLFRPEEVSFISFGSVTFIKPVLQQIRRRGEKSKILQMEMVKDPHGKLTYPDEVKHQHFRTMRSAFSSWQGKVFQYLCMERADIWDAVFGWHYETNEIFEAALLESAFSKMAR